MPTIRRDHIKLKRNSICPCEENMKLEAGDIYKKGKRKKYKNCCLKKMQDQEQQAYMLIHHNERIEKEKKIVAAAIQFDIDHPILLPDSPAVALGRSESSIILP